MADEKAFPEIWEDAVEAYKAKTGRDISKDEGLAELQTTDELLVAVSELRILISPYSPLDLD